MKRRWFDRKGRFVLPFRIGWLGRVPVPRAVRRWYYRLSVRVAGHPSNWHWKMYTLDCAGGAGDGAPGRRPGCDLRPGERCPWCGGYNGGQAEREGRDG